MRLERPPWIWLPNGSLEDGEPKARPGWASRASAGREEFSALPNSSRADAAPPRALPADGSVLKGLN
ncbi:MAG: hypothetical protein AAFY27_09535, partial [Pseudomonadota bacterium]